METPHKCDTAEKIRFFIESLPLAEQNVARKAVVTFLENTDPENTDLMRMGEASETLEKN